MKIFLKKINYKLHRKFIKLLQRTRIIHYRVVSWNTPVYDKATRHQPLLILGDGRIELGTCDLGVWPSPYFFNGYIHIEARSSDALIKIADNVCINNNAVIIAEREKITIESDTLIGTEFTVYDSDFHSTSPEMRKTSVSETAPVEIGRNVFIGSRVTVLKGAKIGNNSVIASGSVVTSSIPNNCIAGGVPAKILRQLPK